MNSKSQSRFVLTISCPDALGIVSAVFGTLVDMKLFLIETHHYGDEETGRFFLRTVFQPEEGVAFSKSKFEGIFADIAKKFEMEWQVHDRAIATSVLLLVSKFDHCLQDLLYRYRTGALNMSIPAVVSNHLEVAPLVQQHGIPFIHIPVSKDTKPDAEARLRDVIDETRAEFVVLARYMQVLSKELCDDLAGKAVNIHHSFLPGFKGAKPYHQAHARGVKLIGATAHFVTSNLDEGPIIEQRVERVDHSYTAEKMVAAGRDIESVTLARAVEMLTERRVFLHGNRTVILQ